MFDDNSPADDAVPTQHPSEIAEPRSETAQYGVVNPGAVSAATFNDMHMLIRKANEEQAAALMNEGKAGKVGTFPSILKIANSNYCHKVYVTSCQLVSDTHTDFWAFRTRLTRTKFKS